jgi:hypothetical protein
MPGEPGCVRRVTHVTAFPEKSPEAGKNGKDKREIPRNLLVFPTSCETPGTSQTDGASQEVSYLADAESAKIRS